MKSGLEPDTGGLCATAGVYGDWLGYRGYLRYCNDDQLLVVGYDNVFPVIPFFQLYVYLGCAKKFVLISRILFFVLFYFVFVLFVFMLHYPEVVINF